MTIEEYLRKRIEDLQDGPCNSSLVQGKILAFEEILSKLPELEHEVTVREVVEECLKHESEGGCGDCVLLREPSPLSPYYCEVGGMPVGWGIDRIEKCMKEARK